MKEAIELLCDKPCYGQCARCVWKYNGGCSEWRVFVEV